MLNYNEIIFDLDGTILDTSEGIIKSVNKTLEENGYEGFPREIIEKFIGPPMQDSFQKYLKLNKIDAWNLSNKFRDIYLNRFLLDAKIYPGIIDLLTTLKDLNIKIGIATSKRYDYTRTLLEAFNIYDIFDFVFGSDMEGKLTKTDLIRKASCFFGCLPKKEILMVGDTIYDKKGADENGIDFIAVAYGFGYDGYEDNNFLNIVHNPMDILRYI